MKKVVLKTYAKALTVFFTLLGAITGCDYFEPRCEYGTPSADFVVKGKVIDKSSRKPVQDIRIIHKTGYAPTSDTVKTNANGEFELKFVEFPGTNQWVYAEDLDGTENGGLYGPDSLTVNSSQMKRIKKGDGSWYQGVFEKNDANFALKNSDAKE
jgi:putative lipoprotein (rSAM/lipoprotein system)